jgi:hypothetical protein
VGTSAGLDDVEKRKYLALPVLEIRTSAVQLIASRYTDYSIPAPLDIMEFTRMCDVTAFGMSKIGHMFI